MSYHLSPVFCIDAAGRLTHGPFAGKPFVLPHAPGEQAFGLVPGWYIWCPGEAEPEGPFASEQSARAARPPYSDGDGGEADDDDDDARI